MRIRCVPKSIRELLYLVRRSKGGVIKAVQGLKDINESTVRLTGAWLILDADGSKMSFLRRIGISLGVAVNVTFCSVSLS